MISKGLSHANIDINKFEYISSVYKVINKDTNEEYAAKVIKNEKQKYIDRSLDREISLMLCTDNPTIMKIIGYCLTDLNGEPGLTILMPIAKNGSLKKFLDKIISKKNSQKLYQYQSSNYINWNCSWNKISS